MKKTAYNISPLDFVHNGYKDSKFVKIGRKAKVIYQSFNAQYSFTVEVPKMGGSFSCKDLNEVNNILNKYLL